MKRAGSPHAVLRVRLTPRGAKRALDRFEEGVLHARVSAAPVDGAANRALIGLLADRLKLPVSTISFQSGETSRIKTLQIAGITQEDLVLRISAAVT